MDNVQITFHPSGSESGPVVPTYSPIFDVSGFGRLVASLSIDAITAASTLTVFIEDSMDGIHWTIALTLGPLGGVGSLRSSTTDFGRFVRARYEWTGANPVATFSAFGLAREF